MLANLHLLFLRLLGLGLGRPPFVSYIEVQGEPTEEQHPSKHMAVGPGLAENNKGEHNAHHLAC